MGWKVHGILAVALGFFLALPPDLPAAQRESGPTPPRLSFMDGEVSFWRPGADDWTPAQVNTPLAAGDSLYTGDDGNLELQLGPGTYVRAGAGTEIGLDSLDSGLQQFKVTAGHAAVDAQRIPKGQAIEIDTPNGAFTIDHPGLYRVDVDENRTTFVTRRGGEASVVPADGDDTDIPADTQIVLEGADNTEVKTARAPEPDEWDRWNLDRNKPRSQPSRSARYVPPDVAGAEDLDDSGDWEETPQYGHVWRPRAVAADWAPYSTGRWVFDPYYGWTWVDDAPWGWAPYHYGRWVFVGGWWGWAPGPVVVAPVYSPALVAFYGGPGVTVSVGAPFVSWVALGWGEPLIPWWGPVGFQGHCWWGGWGGPRVVNNVVIQRNTYVNVRNVTVFQNAGRRNAVIGVRRDHFGRGRVEHVRFSERDVRNLRPVHGHLGVRPTSASLVPREGRGKRPPQAVQNRSVVATRAPQDTSRRLRAEGLKSTSTAPPSRVVEPKHERGRARQERPGGGQSGGGLQTAPPSPRRGQQGGPGERPGRPAPPTHRERQGGGPAGQERGAPVPPAERGHPKRGAGAAGDAERSAPLPPRQMERARPTPQQGLETAPPRHGHGGESAVPAPQHGAEPAPPMERRGGDRPAPPPRQERGQIAPPRVRQGGGHAPPAEPQGGHAPRGHGGRPGDGGGQGEGPGGGPGGGPPVHPGGARRNHGGRPDVATR